MTLSASSPSTDLMAISRFLAGQGAEADSIPWRVLRDQDVRVIREWLAETRTAGDQSRALRALSHALRADEGCNGDADQVLQGVPDVPVRPRKTSLSRMLSRKQVELLLTVGAPDGETGARDRAAISLMLLAGLRRKELVELDISDYDSNAGSLRIAAKGCSRVVALVGPCAELLERWLAIRGTAPGPLFPSSARLDAWPSARLSPWAVNGMLVRRTNQAGMARLSPSDLRGGFVRRLKALASLGQEPCRYLQTEDGSAAWCLRSLDVA